METLYLLICTTGLLGADVPEHCAVYEMRPQYVMTQDVIDEKIIKICAMAREAAEKIGGETTKCEVIGEDEKFEFDLTGTRFLPVPTSRAF